MATSDASAKFSSMRIPGNCWPMRTRFGGSRTMPSGWLNVPHSKQEFHYSCVPACLRMVFAHFGRNHTEDDLRRLLGTGPQGTRAGNLLAAGGLGFEVQLT